MSREPLSEAARKRAARARRWRRAGEPSLGRQIGRVGVLGWIVVIPTLGGAFAGRWLDARFGTGLLFTGPLLIVGLALGLRFGWTWMHKP